jgi:hypothetical protein
MWWNSYGEGIAFRNADTSDNVSTRDIGSGWQCVSGGGGGGGGDERRQLHRRKKNVFYTPV